MPSRHGHAPGDPGSESAPTLLEQLVDMHRTLAASEVDLDGTLALIVERTLALTMAEGASVSLVEGDELYVAAAWGAALPNLHARRPLSTSLVRFAIASRRALLIEDARRDPRLNPELRARIGDRSHICVPLFDGQEPVAALQVMTRSEDRRLGQTDLHTLELMSAMLAAAVSRARASDAELRRLDSVARFEATFEASPTGIALVDAEGGIVEVNPAMLELLGRTAGELVGRRLVEFMPDEERAGLLARIERLMAERGARLRLDHRMLRPGGDARWVSASMSVVRRPDGEIRFAVVTMQDVTDRKQAEEALAEQAELNRHQALHDALTGLANRTLFRDRIAHAIRTARRGERSVAVLVLDLDGFKAINDAYGHAAGDGVLLEIGRRLVQAVRASDTVARLGGDEFGVLLPDARVPDDVLAAVRRIREALGQPVLAQDDGVRVDASVGIAIHPQDGDELELLIGRADAAMYQAKRDAAGWMFSHDLAT